MYFLQIDDGRSLERRRMQFDLPAVTIGRDSSMDVSLDDPTVSRQSAVIIQRDSKSFFQDLGGKNPVRVNGHLAVSHELKEGDVIEIGPFELTFLGEEAATEGESDETILDPKRSIETWQVDCTSRDRGDTLGAPLTEGTTSSRTLQMLEAFAGLIQTLPDRDRLFEAALTPVFDLLDVKHSFIGVFRNGNVLDILAERNAGESPGESPGQGFSRSIVDRVRREKIAIVFSDDPSTPPQHHESRSVVRLKIKSAMCVPIFRGDAVRGVLYLDNRGRARSFTRNDLHFATVLAHLVALAFDKEELYRRVQDENIELKSKLLEQHSFVGIGAAAIDLKKKVRRMAPLDATVLIQGESGTGKELAARALHFRSPRKDGPFVPINCAAIPETLLESELFGYVPQSGIAGANPDGKPGKFEVANGGTLFLDEIGDMSLATQAKILRILEDHVVERLGGHERIPVELRVVAATNKDFEKEISAGRFRGDLFYRLKGMELRLPPLRDRTEDILPIAHHFIRGWGGADVTISPRAQEALLAYRWPGNVRELRNIIQSTLLLGNGKVIYPEDLPEEIARPENQRVFGTLAELEEQHLRRVLDGVNWNKRRAAEILGINRSTLYEKIKNFSLERTNGGE